METQETKKGIPSTMAILKEIDNFHTNVKEFKFIEKNADGTDKLVKPCDMTEDQLHMAIDRACNYLRNNKKSAFDYWYFPLRLELEKRQAIKRAIEKNDQFQRVQTMVEQKLAEE